MRPRRDDGAEQRTPFVQELVSQTAKLGRLVLPARVKLHFVQVCGRLAKQAQANAECSTQDDELPVSRGWGRAG